MELRHIRYFLAVAEEHNFTRAAHRVGIGQPPLSQQIRDLEREIGAPLFYRRAHGAELTEAGSAFLEEARGVLAQADQAKTAAQRAARGETGRLRISFSGSGSFNPLVAGVIRNFRRKYPGVEVSLVEINTAQQLDQMRKGGVDAAFIRPGTADPEGFRLLRFADEAMVVVVPSAHPLASRDMVSMAELKDEPFVLFPRSVGLGLYEEVMRHCRDAGFEPNLVQEAPQIVSVVNLVAAEMGISVVPRSMMQLYVAGVSYVPFDGAFPVARLALAVRRDERSVTVRNFVAQVKAEI